MNDEKVKEAKDRCLVACYDKLREVVSDISVSRSSDSEYKGEAINTLMPVIVALKDDEPPRFPFLERLLEQKEDKNDN